MLAAILLLDGAQARLVRRGERDVAARVGGCEAGDGEPARVGVTVEVPQQGVQSQLVRWTGSRRRSCSR